MYSSQWFVENFFAPLLVGAILIVFEMALHKFFLSKSQSTRKNAFGG